VNPRLLNNVAMAAPSLSRRDFIVGVGAAASLLVLGQTAGAAATPRLPAIDTHVHFYNPGKMRSRSPWAAQSPARSESPADFMRLASPAGVVGMVVIEAIESEREIEDNQWILDEARRNPAIVGYIGRLELEAPDFSRQLNRFAANAVFRGIRPRRQFADLAGCMSDPSFHRGLGLLTDRGLIFESGGPPAAIPTLTKLSRRYPDLRIVFEHLPLIDSSEEKPDELRSVLAEAAAQPNIYAKVSHIMRTHDGRPIFDPAVYRPGLDALFSLFGPDRVMYGSDWPKPSTITSYETIHRLAADYVLPLGPSGAAKFFWRNCMAAYRLSPERVEPIVT